MTSPAPFDTTPISTFVALFSISFRVSSECRAKTVLLAVIATKPHVAPSFVHPSAHLEKAMAVFDNLAKAASAGSLGRIVAASFDSLGNSSPWPDWRRAPVSAPFLCFLNTFI